jgi:8-oxo-dGTP pyrophosphatase MutT (NUDIX family)
MIERVRAVLVTPGNELLTIRRERPGTAIYWILPGGHVEPTDTSLEDALHREIWEELAGAATVHSLIRVVDEADDRQFIYLGRIDTWSFEDRSGPEFTEAGLGRYDLELIPLREDGLRSINLQPEAVTELLVDLIRQSIDPFDLPDLRVAAGTH